MANPFMLTTVLPAFVGILALGIGAAWRQRNLRKEKAAQLARQAVIAKQLIQGLPEGAIEVQRGPIPRRGDHNVEK